LLICPKRGLQERKSAVRNTVSGGDAYDGLAKWWQFVSNARFNGSDKRDILLVKQEDILCHIATGVLGFEEWSDEIKEGGALGEIHFDTKELCASAMKTIPVMPVNTQAITIGALEDLPVEPDVIHYCCHSGEM